jgi:hypothetical protein
MGSPVLIFCGAGNAKFAKIAIDNGWKYGGQLPDTMYSPPFFVDQNWKDPSRSRYMKALEKHRPNRATVLDLEKAEQFGEVMSWAEEAGQYVKEAIIIIPKVTGIIKRIPRSIGGKLVILGYSVPTRYGGTEVPLWEFSKWPVHLLGGSPGRQMYLSRYVEAVSADGNVWMSMAVRKCAFWVPGKKPYRNRYKMLSEIGITDIDDAVYEAFRRSCINIKQAWESHLGK